MKLKRALKYIIFLVVLGLVFVLLPVSSVFSEPDLSLRAINTNGFGVAGNNGIDRMLDAGGYMFLGVDNPNGTTIYRSKDGEDWELISDPGINGDPKNQWTTTLVWFKGALYVGTWQSGSDPGDVAQLFRANAKAPDAEDIEWETINLDGFGNINNDGFTNGIVFKDYIYVGCFNGTEGTEVYRSKTGDPDDWEMCAPKSFNRSDNSDSTIMYVHGNYLYVGTEMVRGWPWQGTALFRTAGGEGEITWEQVNANGYDGSPWNMNTGCITVFKGYMYVGTWNWFGGGCQVFRSNMQGEPPWDWERVISGGFGDPNNHIAQYLEVVNNELFLGCFGDFTFTNTQTGKLISTKDGVNWTEITADGFIDTDIIGILAMTEYKNKLYVGLYGPSAESEVWVYDK